MTRTLGLLGVVALLAGAGRAVQAQSPEEWDPERVVATRPGLEQLKSRLLLAAQSTAYSPRLRAQATAQAAGIDRRLANGDFRPGDRIYVVVEGEAVIPGTPSMTDTFTVGTNRELTMPIVGVVPLAGVLRSDVEPYFKKYLGTFLRSPVVHVRPLLSISVVGKVGHAGFYTVPTGIPITQVLNIAGGPAPEADLTRLEIDRDGKPIWEGASLQRAITEGRTLGSLGVRAGDRIVVQGGATDVYRFFETVSYALGIPIAIYSIIRLFSAK